jgi:S-formylglutathione hydrolase FrmB
VVLFLHGHGRIMLNDNTVFSNLFQKNGLAAVCPDGGHSWWLDVVCEDFHPEMTVQNWLLDSVVPFIEQRFGVQPPQIPLLGISMGGQGVLQLAFRQASNFPIVAAISPAVDFFQLYGSRIPLDTMFPDAEAARQATVVLNLHPLAWPRHQFFCCDPQDHEWFDGAARLGMKLSSSGILHERDLETTGGGHSWEYFNRMAPICLKHIMDSLRKIEQP